MIDRDKMIKRAITFDFERNRREGDFTSPFNPEDMADFAIEEVDIAVDEAIKVERRRIAGHLYELWTQSGTDTDYRHKVATFAKELLEVK